MANESHPHGVTGAGLAIDNALFNRTAMNSRTAGGITVGWSASHAAISFNETEGAKNMVVALSHEAAEQLRQALVEYQFARNVLNSSGL